MTKPLVLTTDNWAKLRFRLKQEYKPSVMLSRSKMRDVLGFTDRLHRSYDEQTGSHTHVCLDFYNEPKRTMFLLKYGDYVESPKQKVLAR